MNQTKHNLKRAAAAFLLFFISMLLYLSGLLDNPDLFLSDNVYSSLRQVNPRIFVIGIDGDTLDRYGPWGTWSRQMAADLINYLNTDEESKPAVIGMDIMFSGNTTDREDSALVNAVRDGENVVLATQATFNQRLSPNGRSALLIEKYEEPFDALRSVASFGLTNIFTDSDGVVRHGLYQFAYGEKTLYSFSSAVTKVYAQNTQTVLPEPPALDSNSEWYIPFAAKPGEYFGSGSKGTSWVRVMDGEIPRELFADSIVLVGPYAAGMMDSYYTSADRQNPMYGVEIHANIVQSLMEGNYKLPLPGWASVIIVFAISVFLYLVFCRFGVRTSTLITAGVCIAYFLAALGLFQVGWILTLLYPLLSFVLIYLALLITNTILLNMEKASLYDQMHHLFINCIRTIANAIDAKDPCTSGHCQRVAEYSLLLGHGLHCSEDDLADLEYAALLHDVGKIGVSDSVLKKNGPLTDEEYAEMKTHPAKGAQILSQIEEFRGRITDGAKYHHERFDGKGYCDGIAGEEIPLFGRIIAIADAYDAMTQNRPYRNRLPREKAISELRRNSGTQFDPELVPIFIELLERQHIVGQPPAEPEKESVSAGSSYTT